MMSDLKSSSRKGSENPNGWGVPITGAICPVCDWSFLLIGNKEQVATRCPYCFQSDLASLELTQDQEHVHYYPELVISPTVSTEKIANGIEVFADKIPFPPNDLNPDSLRRRLRLFFLPVWLVDSSVTAIWEVEIGFNYDVVSHQERFSEGQWRTQEVEETRVRWEPRIGRLERRYQNVLTPALHIQSEIWRRLGPYRVNQAQVYSPDIVMNTLMRLPDQNPEAVWPTVRPALHKLAAAEVQSAAKADYVRKFRWAPSYQDKVWTLLLAPVYATYYADDTGQPQSVLIHPQSGQVDGIRRSSMKSAQRVSLILGMIALVGFVLSLVLGMIGLVIPPLLIIAVIGGVISACVGVGAFIPMLRSWRFNLRNKDEKRSVPIS